MVSSLKIWFARKARCKEVLVGKKEWHVEIVIKVWLDIIHTLRGQNDAISGSSDKDLKKRLAFHKVWQHAAFYTYKQGEMHSNMLHRNGYFLLFPLVKQSARIDLVGDSFILGFLICIL